MPYMASSTLWRLPSWPRHLHSSVPTRCATCFSIASRVFSTWHWTWSPPTWWPIASTWACAWRLMMVSWCWELLDSASSYHNVFFCSRCTSSTGKLWLYTTLRFNFQHVLVGSIREDQKHWLLCFGMGWIHNLSLYVSRVRFHGRREATP